MWNVTYSVQVECTATLSSLAKPFTAGSRWHSRWTCDNYRRYFRRTCLQRHVEGGAVCVVYCSQCHLLPLPLCPAVSLQGHVCFSACLFGLESLFKPIDSIAALILDPNITCSDLCAVPVSYWPCSSYSWLVYLAHINVTFLYHSRVESVSELFLLMLIVPAFSSVTWRPAPSTANWWRATFHHSLASMVSHMLVLVVVHAPPH